MATIHDLMIHSEEREQLQRQLAEVTLERDQAREWLSDLEEERDGLQHQVAELQRVKGPEERRWLHSIEVQRVASSILKILPDRLQNSHVYHNKAREAAQEILSPAEPCEHAWELIAVGCCARCGEVERARP